MYRAPHKCPVCQSRMFITQLSCPSCDSRLEGRFDGCLFCSLSPEESRFLITFIKNRGSIKDVERELGVSYPTVRAALDGLINSLGLADCDDECPREALTSGDAAENASQESQPRDTTEGSASAKRNYDTGDKARARRDILNLLAQHRITADEAARQLKKL